MMIFVSLAMGGWCHALAVPSFWSLLSGLLVLVSTDIQNQVFKVWCVSFQSIITVFHLLCDLDHLHSLLPLPEWLPWTQAGCHHSFGSSRLGHPGQAALNREASP